MEIKPFRKSASGYTLIEVVIVMVIIAFLFLGFTQFITANIETGLVSFDQDKALRDARLAFERVVMDLNNATSIDTPSTANQVKFTAYDGEAVRYFVTGQNLNRDGDVTEVLASGVTSWSLTYLDASNVETTTLADIKCVVIAATFDEGGTTIPLNTTVCPRNLFL